MIQERCALNVLKRRLTNGFIWKRSFHCAYSYLVCNRRDRQLSKIARAIFIYNYDLDEYETDNLSGQALIDYVKDLFAEDIIAEQLHGTIYENMSIDIYEEETNE